MDPMAVLRGGEPRGGGLVVTRVSGAGSRAERVLDDTVEGEGRR